MRDNRLLYHHVECDASDDLSLLYILFCQPVAFIIKL